MSFLSLRLHRFCVLDSPEETLNLGKEIANFLKKPAIIFLQGDLGSGKTTFSKGFIHEKTKEPLNSITSPTFTYMNIYESSNSAVAHYDLYRLNSKDQFFGLGLEEALYNQVFGLIEWPEILEKSIIPSFTLKFSAQDEKRKVELIGDFFAES